MKNVVGKVRILNDSLFCDHCGDESDGQQYHVGSMPVDFDSGNEGESAYLCETCYEELLGAMKND